MRQRTKKQQRQPGELKLPPKYEAILEDTMEVDRAFFALYPEAKCYVRDYIPGEFYPEAPPIATSVKVVLLAPGVRVRSAMNPEYIVVGEGC